GSASGATLIESASYEAGATEVHRGSSAEVVSTLVVEAEHSSSSSSSESENGSDVSGGDSASGRRSGRRTVRHVTRRVTTGSTATGGSTSGAIVTEVDVSGEEEVEVEGRSSSEKSKSKRKHRKSKHAAGAASSSSSASIEASSGSASGATLIESASYEAGATEVHRGSQPGEVVVKKMVLTEIDGAHTWMKLSSSTHRSAFLRIKKKKHVKNWAPQFVAFVHHHKKSFSTLTVKERHKLIRTFCTQHFTTYDERFFRHGTSEEKRIAWKLVRTLSYLYPEVAVQDFGLGFEKKHNLLIIDEVTRAETTESSTSKSIVITMLQASPKLCNNFDDVLLLEDGEVVFHGAAGSILEYFQELGFLCPAGVDVYDFLLGFSSSSKQTTQFNITVTESSSVASQKQVRRTENAGALVRFADDVLLVAGAADGYAVSSEVEFVKHETTSFATETMEEEVAYTTETKTVVYTTTSESHVQNIA
ncbi:hypothetical protein Gpo141_00013454, partial [Globisporangium polare]